MSSQKIDLIRQALSAAESSIRLAKQLLNDLEKDGPGNRPAAKELPGVLGTFDGQELVTQEGEKYPVPENYASKSILVVGDTLKLVDEGKEKRFKQIEHVKRHKTTGILTKKDGKWAAVTSEGSYKLLPAAVAHFGGGVGDEALLQLPANNLQVPWAAVEKVSKKTGPGVEDRARQETDKENKPEQKTQSEPEKPKVEHKPENLKPEAPKEEKPKEVQKDTKPQPKINPPAGGKEEVKPQASAPVVKEEKPIEAVKPEPVVQKQADPLPQTSEKQPAVQTEDGDELA